MIPFIRGTITKQAHVNIPEGTVEEEYAREGFFGRYAHLYRKEAPVDWINIEGDCKPEAFNLNLMNGKKTNHYLEERNRCLYNNEVEIAFIELEKSMNSFFRNADGDDVFFIHEGSGTLETDFGPLFYQTGDYLVVPRGTVYRFFINEKSKILNILAFSEIEFPEKGMLGQHALIDPAVITVPTPNCFLNEPSPKEGVQVYEVIIRRLHKMTKVTYPFHPINTVGWKGTLCPWQFNVKDIRPVLSDRYHLPPSAHTTFVAKGFVICTFLPRPLENGDPNALKVPFYHSNIDYDEVLFYHRGQFFSRTGIEEGMMTFHPQGIHHGPQGDATKRTNQLTKTDEIAIMIDTRSPLLVDPKLRDFENKNYWKSWSQK